MLFLFSLLLLFLALLSLSSNIVTRWTNTIEHQQEKQPGFAAAVAVAVIVVVDVDVFVISLYLYEPPACLICHNKEKNLVAFLSLLFLL